MITAIAGFFARSALMQSPIGSFFKAIPPKAWYALATVAAIVWLSC